MPSAKRGCAALEKRLDAGAGLGRQDPAQPLPVRRDAVSTTALVDFELRRRVAFDQAQRLEAGQTELDLLIASFRLGVEDFGHEVQRRGGLEANQVSKDQLLDDVKFYPDRIAATQS